MEIVILLTLLVFFGIILVIMVRVDLSRGNRITARFADSLGLTYSPQTWTQQPRLTGRFEGMPIEIYTFLISSGRTQASYVVHKVHLPQGYAPSGIAIFHEGFLSKMGKFFGKEDVQTGITDIDDAFIIRGVTEDVARDFLNRPVVRETLLKLVYVDTSIRLENNALTIQRAGHIHHVELVELRLRMIVGQARALSGMEPFGQGEGPDGL